MTRGEFVKIFTKNTPYPWQEEVSNALTPVNSRVTLRCNNEAGKTKMIMAPNAAYDLMAFPRATVLVTSAVYRQLIDQVLPSIKEWGSKYGWTINVDRIRTRTGGLLRAIASEEGGHYEGYHRGTDDLLAPLSIYLDEAKSIHESIFNAVERCRPTRLYIGSSPGAPTGGFYRLCKDGTFKHYTITAYQCPHLPPEHITSCANRFGVSSLLYKSMILAEWMATSAQMYAISAFALQRCMEGKPEYIPGTRMAFLDVARSETGDENVICIRQGNRYDLARCFVGDGDTVRIVDRFITDLRTHNILPEHVWIDADGIGASFADVFRRKGWYVNEWKGSEAPRDKKSYRNARAEAWMTLGRSIEDQRVILPNDSTLYDELTSVMYDVHDGKIVIQSKKEMANSPNRGDAFVGAHHIQSLLQQAVFAPTGRDEGRGVLGQPTLQQMIQGVHSVDEIRRDLPPGFNVGS